MNNPILSIRYAQALFSLALERGEADKVRADMELICKVHQENPGFRQMLKSPVINADKKISVMRGIFGEKIAKISMTYIEIIIRRRRESLLYQIAGQYEELYLQNKNIKRAQITSAAPMQESVRSELLKLLEEQTGATILLEETVDPSIIGGVIVRIDNTVFDDSIIKKLKNLRKEFSVNEYIREI